MKKISFLVIILIILLTAGCTDQQSPDPDTLKVGVTSGPHATIMYAVMHAAAKDGLKIEVVELDGYSAPNEALKQEEIDANSFQNLSYLESVMQNKQYDFVPIARTIIMPMGIYAKSIKKMDAVPPNATVIIPNDHINEGRALVLLEKAGLIKLRPGTGYEANTEDIIENPKHITVQEMDAELIPRHLGEVDLAAINAGYADKAALNPAKNSLIMEDASSPFAHVLVVRSKDKENPLFKKLVQAYHSDEVKQYIAEQFQSTVIPAW